MATTTKFLLVFLTGLFLAACDPCTAAREIHMDRCAAGDKDSCVWLEKNVFIDANGTVMCVQ